MVECWLGVWEVPGSIPSQGPRHTKDVIKVVPVVHLFRLNIEKGNTGAFSSNKIRKWCNGLNLGKKSFEVGGHWPLWWGWKNRMTTQNRHKSKAKQKMNYTCSYNMNNTDRVDRVVVPFYFSLLWRWHVRACVISSQVTAESRSLQTWILDRGRQSDIVHCIHSPKQCLYSS